jgi:type IV pilus assembly protein PilB
MSEPNLYPLNSALAHHLIAEGLLDLAIARQAAYDAEQRGLSFLNYMVINHIIDSDAVFQSCKKWFNLPTFDLSHYDPDWLTSINKELILRYRVIPLHKTNNILHIGLSDPTEQQVLDIILFHTGFKTTPVLVSENQLNELLASLTNTDSTPSIDSSLLSDIFKDDNTYLIQENTINTDEPLIKFVDQMIQQAIQQSASDIHIEPYEKSCRIRYRRDGILYKINDIPLSLYSRFSARLKVMAKLDISERRLPQDGHFQWHTIDVRINTCPTQYGEKIVLRLLDPNKITLSYDKLGLSETQQNVFINKISAPQGLILVTGPTGSGKTVTLYSALHFLNTVEKNISTVEDPIEIQLTGINQVNINPKIHLEFSTVLKTLLRQDPDILMIGEMRDKETANIAIQAAETGHLVLSTIHSNSAIETINRFKSMNHSIYDFINAVTLIIAQRLIRLLCNHCKQPHTQNIPKELAQLIHHPIFQANGCQHCLNGYHGRIGIYELLPFTEKMREIFLSQGINKRFKEESVIAGYTSLLNSGIDKINQEKTSISELQRVLQI